MNAAIVAVILKDFCKPYLTAIEAYDSSEDRFQQAFDYACDEGNDEVIELLQWVEGAGLKDVYFRA